MSFDKEAGCLACVIGLGFTIIFALLAFVIAAGISNEKDASSEDTYRAWIKQNNSALTYDEWNQLLRHYLLPGQKEPDTQIYQAPIVIQQ